MNQMSVPDDIRSEAIKELYKKILNREADLPGLEAYYGSSLTEKEIESEMRSSDEYRVLTGAAEKTSSGLLLDNFLIGMPPKSNEESKSLVDTGVKVVIGIGRSPFITYDQNEFEEHYIVPIGEYGKSDLDGKALNKCVVLLYDKVIKEGKKTYLHSVDGLVDTVLVASVFRSIVKDTSFTSSLYRVLFSSFPVEIDRDLITPTFIKQVLEAKSEVFDNDILSTFPVYSVPPMPVLDNCHQLQQD